MNCDLVFEGGGVLGMALLGGAVGLERKGIRGINFAGTSAGAMIAALLAAGYSAADALAETARLDFKKCMGEDWLDKLGIVGKGISCFRSFGVYHTDYIEAFVGDALKKRGIVTFGDLPPWTQNGVSGKKRRYNLCVTTCDLTSGQLLVLPDDLEKLGLDPATYPIARAVRASISMPLFFEPVRQKCKDGAAHLWVDGGLISTYPMFALDDGKHSLSRPVLGLRLGGREEADHLKAAAQNAKNFIAYLKSIIAILNGIHDSRYTERSYGDRDRTIFVPTAKKDGKTLSSMDFKISNDDVRQLTENGIAAAEEFLTRFNFTNWQGKYRGK